MAEEEKPIEINEPEAELSGAPAEPSEHPPKPEAAQASRIERFKSWYTQRKKWTVPASVLLFILLLAAVPPTRYALAGTVIKHDLSVKVIDATAGTPVSGATVSLGTINAETDGTGKAVLHKVKAGHHALSFTKKYYKDQKASVLAPIFSQKTTPQIQMTATGRQVKINITNAINKKVLSDVGIQVADISAKTDKNGSALIVLPAGTTEKEATLSLDGYNDAKVTVKVSNDKIQDNNFNLTPSGKVYFLSKLSGKIDVVKTDLDGTNRKTVLAGTGKEDDRGTVLLASRDWKYLALLSKRAGGAPALYLIDTSNDNSSTIDEGNADFSLDGWAGDSFVYTVTRNDVQIWQANRQAIKSFDATSKKLTTLDQTNGSGTSQSDYLNQWVDSVYVYSDQVFYTMNWSAPYTNSGDIVNKQATFNSVKPDGSSKKAIKSFGLAAGTQTSGASLESRVESPSSIDLKFSDGTKDNFYTYANGQVKDDPNGTADSFYSASYPTYLQSPSGNLTFWSDPRDGKNTLFVGDQSGQNGKQIATLSDYNTYGWYSDDYLLVSKNSSELYIMPKAGSTAPIKISDYHKPDLTYPGYGGGYGGL
jgi:hypothetical protein